MRSRRFVRVLTLLATASLLVGVFAAVPAEAKKKKKKKKGCATYQAGSNGEGQPTTIVTDAATAEKPATLEVEVGPGLGAGRNPEGEGMFVSHGYTNLQVDPKASSADLNVQIAWGVPVEDFDVYLDTADGTELANSAGFGPYTSGSDYASSGIGTETIVGFPVSDCDGFTVDVVGATTPGATVTVNYWLGSE